MKKPQLENIRIPGITLREDNEVGDADNDNFWEGSYAIPQRFR